MSDLNVTVAPPKSVENATEGVALPSKGQVKAADTSHPVKAEHEKKPKPVASTDLNYSIDHEDNALHLKVKGADGALVRELVFDRIELHVMDTKKLKGIFVDGNS